jgi:hypothetical protein
MSQTVVTEPPATAQRRRREPRMAVRPGDGGTAIQAIRGQPPAVTCLLVSWLVIWMLRGLAFSWIGMARVSTPAV